MTHIPLIDELAIIAGISTVLAVVLGRLRLPTVAGFLLAGALVGPYGFGLVKDLEPIEVLAEVGVILLLFTIGLEFSLDRLRNIFRQVAIGGFLQLGLTFLATWGLALALGLAQPVAILLGFLVGLSSTAIVLRGLAERRELDAPHGRFIVGTLIIQDLAVVPIILIVPLLGSGEGGAGAVLFALGKAALIVTGLLIVARYVVTPLLAWVEGSGSRDIFLLAVLAICIGTAFLTNLVGLSLALGAFLGGMIIAESPFGHRAMGDVLPLRDLFVSLFFVSLGMLFQSEVVLARPVETGLILVGFLLGKGFLATLAAMVMRFPARVAWLAGVGLAQFGEFGFVIAKLAAAEGVIDAATLEPFLAAGILSMFLTPILVRMAPHVTAGERLLAPLERLIGVRAIDTEDEKGPAPRDHVVIVGYGLAARILARALTARGVKHVVLELDPDRVRRASETGELVFYADATSPEALGHAHIESARALAILISNAQATARVVENARRIAPHLPIFVRTKYQAEGLEFSTPREGEGPVDVVVEEIEGGAVITDRVLRALGVSEVEVGAEVEASMAAVLRHPMTFNEPHSRSASRPRPS
jgi:CPA2 family monovalent cation:H+ antiporter-2